MTEYRQTNWKDWTDIFIHLVLMFLAMFVGAVLVGPANLFHWPVVFLAPLVWIIHWHTCSFAYRSGTAINLLRSPFCTIC
jgi:hypothetical protein